MMNNYCVYVHLFPNGKKYVGITCQEPKRRFENGRGYKGCPKMWQAIQKYGWEQIDHIVLFRGLTKERAEKLEIKLIKDFDSIENGYNIEHGGNVPGTHSEETKRKISEGNKGKKVPPVSKETRKRLSESHMGEKNSFYGKHHTESTKRKQSEFMKGNSFNKGNHHSEEFKRWKSEQMKEKYSNGGNPRCKRIECVFEDGEIKTYCSLSEGARQNHISKSSISIAIKNGKTINGNLWRFANG